MLSVLIAEDNVILADMLEDLLVAGGYNVCGSARSVSEAVALADLHNPDLAVIDYRLADGGYGSQIRPRLKDKNTMGILYASGNEIIDELTRYDGEAYIRKPYPINDLLEALRIVHDFKTNAGVSPPFPRTFTFLKIPPTILTRIGNWHENGAHHREAAAPAGGAGAFRQLCVWRA